MSTLPTIFFAAQSEMTEILDAGARSLKQPGLDLLPVKREMLRLPHDHASLVLDACNLLFAAILSYEDAVWGSENARDALALVSARIEAGRARGVVEALFFGPTAQLLLTAMDRAPIAFYAMSEASPDLKIIDRCTAKLQR
jgi:hypothetical protein